MIIRRRLGYGGTGDSRGPRKLRRDLRQGVKGSPKTVWDLKQVKDIIIKPKQTVSHL